MNLETKIKLDAFRPRPYQKQPLDALFNKGYKRMLLVWPRRGGKDVTSWNIIIRAALTKVGVYFYCAPTYSQGRKIIWDSITNHAVKFLDYLPKELIDRKNDQQMKLHLKNGSLIQIIGSDSYDNSIVGSNPQGIIFTEWALSDERAWQFARPILMANDGWAIFNSTPRGKNHLWAMYQLALHSPQWFCQKLTIEDTGHIDIETIQRERASGEMSEDLIQQEYFCFPGTQEVLALDGLKSISDIEVNDMVISHSGRPRKVLNTIKRDYEGDLVKIYSFGSPEPLICTPNHPIRVFNKAAQTYSWKRAEDITLHDRLVFPKMPLGKVQLISYDLCMLIAWYICEGSSFKNGVQFTVGDTREVERITSLLCNINVPYTLFVSSNGSSTNIVVSSTQLVDFFKSLCGTESNNKRIPFIWIATHEIDFFHELMWGDGCYSEHNNYKKFSYTTTSKTLAYQVQLLANSLNLGYAAGITNRKGSTATFPHGKTYKCKDSYSVQIGIKGLREKHGALTRAKYGIAARIKNIERESHKGAVYNLKVQYDESYVVLGRSVHNCSFEMGVEGSFYAKYIDTMRREGRIGIVPHESTFPVHTAWDLGVSKTDSTAIICFQVIGQTIKIIDCYESTKQGFPEYLHILEQKKKEDGWIWGKHFAPHDIKVLEFGSGLTRLDIARNMGFSFEVRRDRHNNIQSLLPPLTIMDGIEQVRTIFPRVWIDEQKCSPLIKALENYRAEFDTRNNVYKRIPVHNWASHMADAMRYLAIAIKLTQTRNSTPEELEKRYREAVYGPQHGGFFGGHGTHQW